MNTHRRIVSAFMAPSVAICTWGCRMRPICIHYAVPHSFCAEAVAALQSRNQNGAPVSNRLCASRESRLRSSQWQRSLADVRVTKADWKSALRTGHSALALGRSSRRARILTNSSAGEREGVGVVGALPRAAAAAALPWANVLWSLRGARVANQPAAGKAGITRWLRMEHRRLGGESNLS